MDDQSAYNVTYSMPLRDRVALDVLCVLISRAGKDASYFDERLAHAAVRYANELSAELHLEDDDE